MAKRRISMLLAMSAGLAWATPVVAQDGLMGRMLRKAGDEAERLARDRLRKPPAAPRDDGNGGPTPAPSSPRASAGGAAGGTLGPSATVRHSDAPQDLWLDVRYGAKLKPAAGKPQIIVTNPFMAADNFLFATMKGMDCAADGSVIVAGEGWQNGEIASIGWWRIAADGAVTPIASHARYAQTTMPLPYSFSAGKDGSLLTMSGDAVYRVQNGRSAVLAGEKGARGYQDGPGDTARFDQAGYPVEDGQGNVWISDQNGCVLRRITADGDVSTVIGKELSACGTKPGPERIPLSSIAWDATNGELVVAGSVIVARPTHDLHVSVWRVRPDGQARRVYHTVKAGRSAIGQNMDHIWAATVDAAGRVVVATRPIPGFARRQIMRLDEKAGRLVPVTGQAFGYADIRPGGEEEPHDGPAARASFREGKRICYAPDRTLFVPDEHLVRRINADGTVRTWAY